MTDQEIADRIEPLRTAAWRDGRRIDELEELVLDLWCVILDVPIGSAELGDLPARVERALGGGRDGRA